MTIPAKPHGSGDHQFLNILIFGCCGILCVQLVGCALTSAGHIYRPDEIAFLNEAGTTRAEAISSLGTPELELKEAGLLVYKWETATEFFENRMGLLGPNASRWSLLGPKHLEWTVTEPKDRRKFWVLFIAYDARQLVTANAVRSFRDRPDLKAEALAWASAIKR